MVRVYQRSSRKDHLIAEFPNPSDEIMEQLDCPYYREENALEKVGDFFERIFSPQSSERKKENEEKKKEKRGFFMRLFGGKKDKEDR